MKNRHFLTFFMSYKKNIEKSEKNDDFYRFLGGVKIITFWGVKIIDFWRGSKFSWLRFPVFGGANFSLG